MPPKRPLRKPQGPTGPIRTALHTQELMLFCSPVATAAAPAKRTASTTRRGSGGSSKPGAGVSVGPPAKGTASLPRSRAPLPPTSSTTAATAAAPPSRGSRDYEPLSQDYLTAHGGRAAVLSASAPGAAPLPPHHHHHLNHPKAGHRVPSPPPSRAGSGEGGVVASGSSSRVVRLLRDARAAVQDPIRPETPLSTALPAATAALLPRQPPHGVESRLRRRLPAGNRLTPMPGSGATDGHGAPQSSGGGGGAALSPLSSSPPLGSSPPALPLLPAGLSSQINVRADRAAKTASTTSTTTASPSCPPFDVGIFAVAYAAAQQRGEEGLVESMHLLTQLQAWLASEPPAAASLAPPPPTPLSTSSPSHTLSPAATASLQTTLMHFCQHWPTGDALRTAVENYAAVSGLAESRASLSSEPQWTSAAVSASVPLSYAEVALLAAAVMLRAYPVASLVAEPISFQALLCTLHTIAKCGLADWVTLESGVLEVVLAVLQSLTAAVLGGHAAPQYEQCIVYALDILTCCCEEAARATSTATAASPFIGDDTPQALFAASSSGVVAGRGEQDMIRGYSLADDVVAAAAAAAAPSMLSASQRAASASLLSSTASLPRPSLTQAAGSSSSSSHTHPSAGASAVPQGSPLNVLRHGSSTTVANATATSSAAAAAVRQPPDASYDGLTARLVSQGLLHTLQHLCTHALGLLSAAAATPSSPSAAAAFSFSVLPAIGSLYRLLTPSHADAMRRSGVLTELMRMLQLGAADSTTVESAGRALVKLTYDDDCLAELQASGAALLDAVGHALLSQLRLGGVGARELLVSRLCGVMARVAEGSAALQAHLTTPAMTHVLEVVTQRYLSAGEDPASPRQLPSAPVVQSVVWVLGIAAMSPGCSLHLVEFATPLLVSLLQRLRETPAMRTTAVYVLMCLSNLSYFFNRFEHAEGGDAPALSAEELHRHAAWRTAVCASLGITLAEYLFEDNVEATVEATRILGNLSYTNTGRDWMEENKCDEVVVIFLGHEDLRVVYNCCGVLLNLTAASPCRVVAEPELLQMMLSYTSRYTTDDAIRAAAATEAGRLQKQRSQQRGGRPEEGATGECAAEANSSAVQIADLVGKLLMNVHGLLALAAEPASDMNM